MEAEKNNSETPAAKSSTARKTLPPNTSVNRSVGCCPACEGAVLEEPDSFVCQNLSEGCSFSFKKNRLYGLGKNDISRLEMAHLLEGKILPLRGLKKREGTRFDRGGELCRHDQWGWQIELLPIGHAEELPRPLSLRQQRLLKLAKAGQ